MTVRYFDRYGTLGQEPVWIGMNRGVSGIDGTLATALGMSMALNVPATIVLGDLAMIYDLNALTLRPQTTQPITVIVLNDGGGSIFERLPIAHHAGVFGPYFRADHAFHFADVAHALGWEAISVRGARQLEEALNGRDQYGSYFVNVALQ
jgi:2-succinyl-5-enolpyruvyl-6-hydroxy-3-cyclohexene-1-carboxylate synthase